MYATSDSRPPPGAPSETLPSVLMLTHTYHPSVGGGIRYKTAVVDYLRSRGHRVDVLAASLDQRGSIESDAGGALIRVPTLFEANSSAICPAYAPVFRSVAHRYDVLFFNFPSPMAELAMLVARGRASQAKKIAMYHADIVPAKRFSGVYNRLVVHPFLAAMDDIIVSSPNIVESSPHLNTVREKVRVIPFGLDPDDFPRPTRSVEKSGRSGGPLNVVFVGRLSRYKGVDVLIRAIAPTTSHLTIVGAGPLRDGLERLVSSLGLGARVRFAGRVSDAELLHVYHAADVLVLPSTDAGEAFGFVLAEAMMCEAAAVSTELGTGTSFVNLDGVTGYVVPPGDVDALSRALSSLERDRHALRRFQTAARQRILEHFDLRRMLDETRDLVLRKIADS